mgnify:CR=1 FL=1
MNNFESTLKYNSKGCTPYNLVDFSIFRFSFLFSFLCPTLLCQFFIIILRLSKRIAFILAALISSLHHGRWRDGGKLRSKVSKIPISLVSVRVKVCSSCSTPGNLGPIAAASQIRWLLTVNRGAESR